MMIKRPVGFWMSQAMTIATSSSLFGIAGYLNMEADAQALSEAAAEAASLASNNLELTTIPMDPLEINSLTQISVADS